MHWRKVDPGCYSKIVGMDPRADWLLGPGRSEFLPDERRLIPFIMRVEDRDALGFVNRLLLVPPAAGHGPPFFVPSLHLTPGIGVKPGYYVTVLAPLGFFHDLATRDEYRVLREARKRIHLGLPMARPCGPDWEPGRPLPVPAPAPVGPPDGGWPPGTVVVGVIDDGIAFAHERFRTRDGGTRVKCFWRQDGRPDPGARTVDYGRELWKRDFSPAAPGIDTLLRECGGVGGVDEEEVYRRAGSVDFAEPDHKAVAWRIAHGTHVLDLAAGEDPACDRRDRPIVCVQLPVAATADTSGAGLECYVQDAIKYILRRAADLAGDGPALPVVINFSYGTNAGPHDGTSPLETFMDDVVAGRKAPVRFVLPAGNGNNSRAHARVIFPQRPGAPFGEGVSGQPWCRVERAGMINSIATGRHVVVAGGFLGKELRPASYSAGGPITPARGAEEAGGRKPDALLVSDVSKVHGGVLAAGARSGSVVAMRGTSVAAPQMTRLIADELGAVIAHDPAADLPERAGDRAAVRELALRSEARLPVSAPALPAHRGGWGRVEGTRSGIDRRVSRWVSGDDGGRSPSNSDETKSPTSASMVSGYHSGSGRYGTSPDVGRSSNNSERQLKTRKVESAARVEFLHELTNAKWVEWRAGGSVASTILQWRMYPDNQKRSILEIWLPYSGAGPPDTGRIRFYIATPRGEVSLPLTEGENVLLQAVEAGQVICEARYQFVPAPTERGVFLIMLQPTARLLPTSPAHLAHRVSPSGVWEVRLWNLGLGPADQVHAWIEQDNDSQIYNVHGHNTHFVDPNYVRIDASGREVSDDSPEPLHGAGVISGTIGGVVGDGFQNGSTALPTKSFDGPFEPFPEAAPGAVPAPLPVGDRVPGDALVALRASSAPHGVAPSAPPGAEPVDAAVFCPPRVATGGDFLVQVFLYQPGDEGKVGAQAWEADAGARRRGAFSLPLDLPRGTRVDLRLEMPGLAVAEPDAVLVWRGRPAAAQFEVSVSACVATPEAIGRVRFAVDGVPAGTLRFKVALAPPGAAAAAPAKPIEVEAARYRTAFVSYCSEDRAEVVRRVQAFRIAGLSVFQDVLDLDPGQRWERELYREIDRCDVFLLFWSRAAAASGWVAKEIAYALERKGGIEDRPPVIQPVPIEGPPPPPPPSVLKHLHFNDALLAHIQAATVAAHPQSRPPRRGTRA